MPTDEATASFHFTIEKKKLFGPSKSPGVFFSNDLIDVTPNVD